MRSLRDLAETYGASALALVCAFVAGLGWLVVHLAWAGIEALHGQSEPRLPPPYLIPLGIMVFVGAALLTGALRLRRGQ